MNEGVIHDDGRELFDYQEGEGGVYISGYDCPHTLEGTMKVSIRRYRFFLPSLAVRSSS